jgi:8-oxo-dGTP pyrophosphatase MutT (NUDIX family)
LWFGGCVQKGTLPFAIADETYEENAVRELKEEAGVQATNQELHHLFDFYFENERTKSWGRVSTLIILQCYYHLFEGTLKDLEPGGDEVELIKLVSRDEILGMI